jgi:hypothetical protein
MGFLYGVEAACGASKGTSFRFKRLTADVRRFHQARMSDGAD